jgi:hypothetical protein
VRKPEGKTPLGRRIYRWVDGIKKVLRVIKLGVMNWIDLAQNWDQWRAVVNMVMKLQVP